jgi:two-component system chemotaxis response regulator CheB
VTSETGATAIKSTDSATAIRVMVVDDSAVIRGLVSSMLEADPAIKVVASCNNGLAAVQGLTRADPDVVILDIEMPVMDGITALPKLLAARPGTSVIVASTLSQRNAEISLQALALGAADYIPKPEAANISGRADFKRELLDKVHLFGKRSIARRHASGTPAGIGRAPNATATAPLHRVAAKPMIALRKAGLLKPQILAIGSSTGGPQALNQLLKALPTAINVPIVITQHMPPTFTSILAQHVAKASGWPCREAQDGETILPGNIYVAPGDHHLLIDRKGPNAVARLTRDPPENFCRPAVDPMLRSLAQAYGGKVLTVILTGMGSDGLKGGREIISAGGTIVAQDEDSSVVWGMPGAVATAGLCTAVLPLGDLTNYVTSTFTGRST